MDKVNFVIKTETISNTIANQILKDQRMSQYNLTHKQISDCLKDTLYANHEAFESLSPVTCIGFVSDYLMPALCRLFQMDSNWTSGDLELLYYYILDLNFKTPLEFEATGPAISILNQCFMDAYEVLRVHYWHQDELLLADEVIAQLENPEEYRRFQHAYTQNHINLMIHLNDLFSQTKIYAILYHVLALSLDLAGQLAKKGTPVDCGRIAGACVGYGAAVCGLTIQPQVGIWFDRFQLLQMKHIARNHGAWHQDYELELENLSVESLVLLYADFTVNSHISLNRHMLDSSNSKNRKLFAKLQDFERYLHQINGQGRDQVLYPLLHGEAVTRQYRLLAVEHNVAMMHLFRDEASLNGILEEAASTPSHHRLRGYLSIFHEYHQYLTTRQKNILITFLFERLTHGEEDVREYCARMMGEIVAHYGDVSSLEVVNHYFKKFLEADVATTPKHRDWIGQALSFFIQALLEHASETDVVTYTVIVKDVFNQYRKDPEVLPYMLRVLKYLPLERCSDTLQVQVLKLVYEMALQENVKTKLEALDALRRILRRINPKIVSNMNYDPLFDHDVDAYKSIVSYMETVIRRQLGTSNLNDSSICAAIHNDLDASAIYLSNLKTATPPVIKRLQIDMLIDLIHNHKIDGFHAAMHFSNVLKVSAFQEVRERAGQALVSIFHRIPQEQRNDIVIELLRALEIEGYQFTKYIPPYLGVLINALSPLEHSEIIDDLVQKMKSASPQICLLVLSTAGTSLVDLFCKARNRQQILDTGQIKSLFRVFFNGLVHFDAQVSQSAFQVIGHDIFGSKLLNLDEKRRIYTLVAKKIMSIITQQDDPSQLTFMYYASSLNHMYRFVIDALDQHPTLPVNYPDKVAFFPGSFDPFSLAHKASACRIRDMGYEVYLAVDEFSWSKRTQPNMIRRNIVKMSIADELDIYTFPRSLIVNLANPDDILELKSVFMPRDTYLVMGSDVLTHASAYQGGRSREVLLGSSHIIFERAEGLGNRRDDLLLEAVLKEMKSHVVRLTLDTSVEAISSTQIRTYVDQNRDISDLTETLVQKFIYEKGLYRREPQFKDTMTVRALAVEVVDNPGETLIQEVAQTFNIPVEVLNQAVYGKTHAQSSRMLIIRDLTHEGKIQACSLFHWLRTSAIYREITSEYLGDYVRRSAVGRVIVIDALLVDKGTPTHQIEQVILTETLAYCLAKDYSYCIYTNVFALDDPVMENRLKRNGFLEVADDHGHTLFAVNMSDPITLSLDCKSMIKAPYRNDPEVETAIENARENLCGVLCSFFPGHLVLGFDRTMIYEHLIELACRANEVPTEPTQPRVLGKAMLVPYGDVFKRWILPNTVTKALHTERYYNDDISRYEVKAYPNYLDLEIQASTIKSFNRPVILVDDLLDRGYRLKAVLAYFKKQNVPIKEIDVGILSGRGKAWLESMGISVKAAYFIPRIRFWFNESHLYPMVGGDALTRSALGNTRVLPSINLILPYVYPRYMDDVDSAKVSDFSRVCLENAHGILKALERTYLERHERNLTMNTLSDVLLAPRSPEKGAHLHYQPHTKPTDILQADIEWMSRINPFYQQPKGKI